MTRNNCYRSGFMVFFILALAFCALDAPAFTVESSGAGCAVDLDLNTTDYDPRLYGKRHRIFKSNTAWRNLSGRNCRPQCRKSRHLPGRSPLRRIRTFFPWRSRSKPYGWHIKPSGQKRRPNPRFPGHPHFRRRRHHCQRSDRQKRRTGSGRLRDHRNFEFQGPCFR